MSSLLSGLQNALTIINPFSQPTNHTIQIPVPIGDNNAFFDSFITNDSNYIVTQGYASKLNLLLKHPGPLPTSAPTDDYGVLPIYSRAQTGQLVALLSPESVMNRLTMRSLFNTISGTVDGSIIVGGPLNATRPTVIVWLDAIRFPNQRILVLQVPDAPHLGINFTALPLNQPAGLSARISLDGSVIALGAFTYTPKSTVPNQGGLWIWKLRKRYRNTILTDNSHDQHLYELVSVVPFVDPNILASPVDRGFGLHVAISGNGQVVAVSAVGLLNAAVPSGFLSLFSTERRRFYGPLNLDFPGLKDPSFGVYTSVSLSGDGLTLLYGTETIVDQNTVVPIGSIPTKTAGGVCVFNVASIDLWFRESTYWLGNLDLQTTTVQLEFLAEFAGLSCSCSNDGLNLAFSAGAAAWYYSREADSFRYTLFHEFLDPNVQVSVAPPEFEDTLAAVSIDSTGTWLLTAINRLIEATDTLTDQRLTLWPVYIPRSIFGVTETQFSTLVQFDTHA